MMYEKEFELAKLVASKAGQFLVNTEDKNIESAFGHDIKLDIDKNSEDLIMTELKALSDYPVLSEEAGWVGDLEDEKPYWVIDPIDGTLNFFQEIPFACVSIALWKKQEPILGVIYDFNRDEIISGLKGVGAFLNDNKLTPPEKKPQNQSVLATGYPSYLLHNDETLLRVIHEIKAYKKIRLFGSAALSLAYVALGRVQAYREDSIAFWDVAAGLAVCSSMGLDYVFLPSDSENNLWNVELKQTL